MKDVKMSDSMILEIEESNHKVSGFALCAEDTGRVVASCYSEGDANNIANAVNSHDKLIEQNKLLRDALVTVDEVLSGYSKPPMPVKLAILKIREALREDNAN
jgi:hypothetical protein